MVCYQTIEQRHLPGVIDICRAEGWKGYAEDAERTWAALTAPGVTTVVAVENEEVAGFAQMMSDGHIQAFLSAVCVSPAHRRKGIGRRLIDEAFARAGGIRVDLTTDSADEFYQSFRHRRFSGYRIYPQAGESPESAT